jgi:hypothetical protein
MGSENILGKGTNASKANKDMASSIKRLIQPI